MKKQSCPMSAKEVVETYFLENRARLLDIAAFLDRIDRAGDRDEGKADFRYRSFRRALRLLVEGQGDRTKALLLSFSDLSREPLVSAAGLKGACGAWEGAFREDH